MAGNEEHDRWRWSVSFYTDTGEGPPPAPPSPAGGEERPRSPPRRQRACLPCMKSKARCKFESNSVDNGCERCRRMELTCTPQTTRSLRKPRQLKSRLTAIGRPSATSHQIAYNTIPSGSSTLASGEASRSMAASFAAPAPAPTGARSNEEAQSSLPTSTAAAAAAAPSKVPARPGFGLTWEQAEQAVSDYRIRFVPHFPFVPLDPEVTAQDVFLKKPFLFRVVLLVAARLTVAKQKELKRSVSAYVGQHLVVMGKRSLDLLQGLLVYVAWGNLEFYDDKQITHLIYLTVGYVHNLGLSQRPLKPQQKATLTFNPSDAKEAMRGVFLTTIVEESHSLEEQRCLLGCYYLMSLNSVQFDRQNTLGGEYTDHCIELLRQSVENQTDSTLALITKLQQVVERITEALPCPRDPGHNSKVTFTESVQDEMRSIRRYLDETFTTVAHKHRHFTSLWITHNYILVRLYAPAMWLPSPPRPSSSSSSPPHSSNEHQQQHNAPAAIATSTSTTTSTSSSSSSPSPPTPYRNQCLLSCLQAAKSFFGALLSVGPEGLLHRPFPAFYEVMFVTVAASRLLLLRQLPTTITSNGNANGNINDNANGDGDGGGNAGEWKWDLDAARATLDLPAVLQRLVELLEEARALRDRRAAVAGGGGSSGTDRAKEDDDVRGAGSGDGDGRNECIGSGIGIGISVYDKDDPFKMYIIKVRWMKGWLEARLAGRPQAAVVAAPGGENSTEEYQEGVEDESGGSPSLDYQAAYDWFSFGLMGSESWSFDG